MTIPREPMQSLWVGPRLGMLERLAIASFLAHGHAVHLYLYEDCAGVPDGVTRLDANAILPVTRVFTYPTGFGKGVPSGFANLFRYVLLAARGGWWMDLDMVALRPIEIADAIVVGESPIGPGLFLENAVLRAPAGSPFMQECARRGDAVDPAVIRWGQTGPRLVTEVATELSLQASAQPADVFYPLSPARFLGLFRPGPVPATERTVAIHLWAQLWRHYGLDPNGRYPADSPYEQLLRRYLSDEAAKPRRRVSVWGQWLRTLPGRLGGSLQMRRQRRRR
jgi:hypothetical protein